VDYRSKFAAKKGRLTKEMEQSKNLLFSVPSGVVILNEVKDLALKKHNAIFLRMTKMIL
jgi:hypothetical protein